MYHISLSSGFRDLPRAMALTGSWRLLAFCLVALLYFGCTAADAPPRLGGDRDKHGCIGSAGYVWCEGKQKCLRIWEEPCPKITAHYVCKNLGSLVVEYYEDGRAVLKLGKRQYVLHQTISASGARYEGKGMLFWEKGGRARLIVDGNEDDCLVP
jgi:membrane-bound inhibitor of C-type lysozyme